MHKLTPSSNWIWKQLAISQEWKLKVKEEIEVCSVRCNTKNHFMDTAYILNSCEILSKDIHKDLGVMISSDLTFEAHYNYIVSRAYQTLGLL